MKIKVKVLNSHKKHKSILEYNHSERLMLYLYKRKKEEFDGIERKSFIKPHVYSFMRFTPWRYLL